jgi:hypothetical protein
MFFLKQIFEVVWGGGFVRRLGWRKKEKVKNARVFLFRSDRILVLDKRGVTLHNYAFRPLVIDFIPAEYGHNRSPMSG